jgi:hypothetical protein
VIFKRSVSFIRLFGVVFVFILLAAPEWPAFEDERFKLDTILGQQHFDFLTWGVKAFVAKGEALLIAGDQLLDEREQKEFVLAYLDDLEQVRRFERQIDAIYADPEIDNPVTEAEELQKQVNTLRVDISTRQPIAESILEKQVSSILNEEEFDLVGYTWPPVLMRMTPLPMVLIVSPREEIRQIYNIPLNHGLSTETRENIEDGIYESVDRSALVTPIGGLGFYPAMIVETSDINFLVGTIAHEWAHHWLSLRPVGLNVFANNEMLRINETVASIVGEEIGRQVIERYYPEFAPAEDFAEVISDNNSSDPPAFDFNAEMRLTRVNVDALLANDQVDEAEAYMEERRQFFWDNGYRFRKLNQAFFAFRGSYADEPGEQGDDPIGPTLIAIRGNSPSLKSFLNEMSSVTSVSDLEEIARDHGIS